MTTTTLQISSTYLLFKLLFDLLLAVISLIIFGPLMLIVALMIVLDSKGPSLYRQQRVGQFGKEFTILKFRSMRTDAPNISTAEMEKMAEKPFTRIGPMLRKTSIDELPQLLNILRGQMSFIGPRPALPSQTDVNTAREEAGVHQVRPGLTGLAQIMGRDELDCATKVGYDTDYCRNMSLGYDIKIFFQTFKAVFTARGIK